jgi:hypothetical protein
MYAVEPSVLPQLAPTDPQGSLLQLWQVHTVFVAIAFAGLAILFQLASDPVVTSRSLRSDLVRHTFFITTLAFALAGAIQLGLIALWFPTAAAIVIEFLLIVTVTVFLVALAYIRTARIFARPEAALELGKAALVDLALDSLYENWAQTEASRRLEERVPRDLSPSLEAMKSIGIPIAHAPMDGEIEDVRLEPIEDALRGLEAKHNAGIGTHSDTGPTTSGLVSNDATASLKVRFSIGSRVKKGDPLFLLEGLKPSEARIASMERRLMSAIKWTKDD